MKIIFHINRALRWPYLAHVLLLLAIALGWTLPRVYHMQGANLISAQSYDDQGDHIYNAHQVYKRFTLSDDKIKDPFFNEVPERQYPVFYGQWPIGVYLASVLPVALLDPISVSLPQVVNAMFFLVLVVALYFMGRRMGNLEDGRIGLLAAVLVALNPSMLVTSFAYHLDFPLIAMTTLGFLMLWRTEGFTKPGACLAFALCSAGGLLAKMTYALYLFIPSAYALFQGLSKRGQRARVLGLALLSTVVCLLAFLAVERFVLDKDITDDIYRAFVFHFVGGNKAVDCASLGSWNIPWALSIPSFILLGFSPALILIGLPGLIGLHRPPRSPASKELMAVFWGGLVMLTLMAVKMERYVHPIYPAITLIMSWWLLTRLPKRWRAVAVVLVIGVFAFHNAYPLRNIILRTFTTEEGPKTLLSQTWYFTRTEPEDRALQNAANTVRSCFHNALLKEMREVGQQDENQRFMFVYYFPLHWPGSRFPEREVRRILSLGELQKLAVAAFHKRYFHVVEAEVNRENPARVDVPSEIRYSKSTLIVYPEGVDLEAAIPGFKSRHKRVVKAECLKGYFNINLALGSYLAKPHMDQSTSSR